jgi:hypothetical protein
LSDAMRAWSRLSPVVVVVPFSPATSLSTDGGMGRPDPPGSAASAIGPKNVITTTAIQCRRFIVGFLKGARAPPHQY